MSKQKQGALCFTGSQPAAANFAAEKTQKKKRKPKDQLEYDVMQAEALGYGCHYGRYKADHPNTAADFEALHGKKQAPKADPQKRERTCINCGAKFIVSVSNSAKVYCSDDCRVKAQQARAVGRGPALYCTWCGEEIPRGSHRTRYCCNECGKAAEKERYKKTKETADNEQD